MAHKPRPIQHEIHEYLATQTRDAGPHGHGAPPLGAPGLDALMDQAEQALAEAEREEGSQSQVQPFQLRNFVAGTASIDAAADLNREVDLDLKIELGRTRLTLEEATGLSKGAMLVLDKLAGDPVDVLADGRLIARGQVLVLNDKFCVRVTELLDQADFA